MVALLYPLKPAKKRIQIMVKSSLQDDLSFNNVDYPQHWEREDITVEVEAGLTHIGRYLLPKHPT